MFISHKSAQQRLSSRQNHLRERFVPSDDPDSPIIEGEVLDKLAEDPDLLKDGEADSEKEEAIPFAPDLDDMLESGALDKLIDLNPAKYHPYRGKIEAQAAIAETSIVLGSTTAGRLFGISNSQAGAYDDGDKSTGRNLESPELVKRVRKIKLELQEAAADRLKTTLSMLDSNKLKQVTKATDLSKIAKDMAGVLDRVSDKEEKDPGGTHFHIYRPEIKQENTYQTVQVGVNSDAPAQG